MSAPQPIYARTPLGRLYYQHCIKAGIALNEAHDRLVVHKEELNSARLNELARVANKHDAVCAGLVGAAYVLLDGDGFIAFCRDIGLKPAERDEAFALVFSDLPNLPA